MVGERPTDETVFLVSGGAKGITAACVIELARRYGSRFILVGRSAYELEPEPEWAMGLEDEAGLKRAAMHHLSEEGGRPRPKQVQQMVRRIDTQREIAHTLQAVTEAGGRAVYVSADVTDASALAAAATEGASRLGSPSTSPAINGVIHGAGVLADRLVQDKSVADFERVLSVKVEGLRNLLDCVVPGELEYLVLFSSVAGFYGNVGQVDYAMANEVLNKAAYWVQQAHPACRVLSINWGPWDGGMVTPELTKQLKAHGVEVIPLDFGTDLLAELLETPPAGSVADEGDPRYPCGPQLVVGSPMPSPLRKPPAEPRTYHLRRRLAVDANPFLDDHVIGGRAVLPTVCAVAWMVNAGEQIYPGYRFVRVDDYRVFKGIVFDEEGESGSESEEHVLDLKVEPVEDEESLRAEALIWSELANGRPRYHYRAEVLLRRSGFLSAPSRALTLPNHALISGADLYGSGVLFHGPSFQGIQEVLTMDQSGLLMRCRSPKVDWTKQGQFPVQTFNPYVVDVQLQSLLVWSRQYLGHSGLPLRIQSGVQYRPLDFEETTYVTMEVRSQTQRNLVADVTIQLSDGSIAADVRGAEITLSERLNALFLDNKRRAGAVYAEPRSMVADD